MLDKESIGPAMMIETAATSSATVTMTEDAAQTHTDPTIEHNESETTAVLKVLKPTFHGPIHVQDDDRQAIAVGPSGLLTDGIFELP